MASNKRIRGITIELDGQTGKLEDALKSVENKLKSTSDSLKDVDKLLKLDPGNVELLTQKQQYLTQAIDGTEDKLKQLREASAQAASTAGNYDAWKVAHDEVQAEIGDTSDKLAKLRDAAAKADEKLAEGKISQEKYDKLQAEVAETETRLKALKQESKDVDEQFGHPISPEAFDAIQREIADTEQQLNGLNDQLGKLGGDDAAQKVAEAGGKVSAVGDGITSVGNAIMPVSQKLISLGTDAAGKFAEVDKIMALTNKTMNNSAEDAAILDKAMAEAAANSTFGMADAANATLNFARAGLDAQQAAAALAPAMNLAAGEGGNLDVVSAGLVATINGFGDSFENTGHYADVFAAACNKSALDVDSLSSAMSVAAPIFRTAGYDVEDAALYLGIMANNGIDANKAANSLKTGMAKLAAPAKEGATWISRLGLEIFNSDGSMKDSLTVQKELHEAFATLSEQEQMAAASAIFGKNQMAPWLALINTAPAEVDELSNSLANSKGTTEEMANAMMSGFGGSIEKLNSSVDVLMTTLGRMLAEYLQPFIDAIQRGVDWLNSLDEGTRNIIVTIGLVVAAIGPLLTVIGPIVSAVGTLMTMASQISAFLTAAQGGVSGFLGIISSHPIAAAIAGVVAAVVLLYNNCEWFRDAVQPIWDAIKTAVETVFGGIADFIGGIFKTLGEASELSSFGNAVEYVFWSAWNWIEETWDKAADFFSGIWTALHQDPVLGAVADFLSAPFRLAWDAIKTAWSVAGDFFTGNFEGIKKTVDDKLGAIQRKFTEIWDKVTGTVRTAIDNIKGFFNFEWKLPHIPLPHFKVTGQLDLLRLPPQVPSLGIDWYRKAMDDGMILTSPTIFGAANGRLLGGGEAGAEAVVGVDSLRDMVRSAVTAAMPAGSASPLVQVHLMLKETELAQTIFRLNRQETQRVGLVLTKGGG